MATLMETLKRGELVLTGGDVTTLVQCLNVLESGVGEVRLTVDEKHVHPKVEGNFVSVSCTNVAVKNLQLSQYDTKTDCKNHIRCSTWTFPCPDYKHSHIRDNLERAIRDILNVHNVEVVSFDTGIVEYDDENEGC